MRKYFKDYGELCKSSIGFYKKHWLGTIIMQIITFFIGIYMFWPKDLRDGFFGGIKENFSKKDESED